MAIGNGIRQQDVKQQTPSGVSRGWAAWVDRDQQLNPLQDSGQTRSLSD